MRGMMFRGWLVAALTVACSVAAAVHAVAVGALERMLSTLALVVGGTPPTRNTATPNLGMQRVQVGAFQRRRGESARRTRYRRLAYGAFGTAALAC